MPSTFRARFQGFYPSAVLTLKRLFFPSCKNIFNYINPLFLYIITATIVNTIISNPKLVLAYLVGMTPSAWYRDDTIGKDDVLFIIKKASSSFSKTTSIWAGFKKDRVSVGLSGRDRGRWMWYRYRTVGTGKRGGSRVSVVSYPANQTHPDLRTYNVIY